MALQICLVLEGVGTAIAVSHDRRLRHERRVAAIPLDPPLPYTKALIWRAQPPAPVRALLALRTDDPPPATRSPG